MGANKVLVLLMLDEASIMMYSSGLAASVSFHCLQGFTFVSKIMSPCPQSIQAGNRLSEVIKLKSLPLSGIPI